MLRSESSLLHTCMVFKGVIGQVCAWPCLFCCKADVRC